MGRDLKRQKNHSPSSMNRQSTRIHHPILQVELQSPMLLRNDDPRSRVSKKGQQMEEVEGSRNPASHPHV